MNIKKWNILIIIILGVFMIGSLGSCNALFGGKKIHLTIYNDTSIQNGEISILHGDFYDEERKEDIFYDVSFPFQVEIEVTEKVEMYVVDILFSNSNWVRNLFNNEGYDVGKKLEIFKKKYNATNIRNLITRNKESWKSLVPKEVVQLMIEYNGIDRIRNLHG